MNLDFHYNATYTAARLAGYDYPDAITIATSAQYVDDSDSEKRTRFKRPDKPDVYIAQTCQKISKLLSSNVHWTERTTNESIRLWTCFHFLPGNFKRDEEGHVVPVIPYQGARNHEGKLTSWMYDGEAEEQFKYICLPNSILVNMMLEDTIDNHAENLHMIGLRMHVLADTWSHKYFTGIPAWFLNGSTRYEGLQPNSALAKAPYYNSNAYLGHGIAGYTPDYGNASFGVYPYWSNDYLRRNNQRDFYRAFKKMYTTMYKLKNGDDAPPLDELTAQAIKDVLKTATEDQTRSWIQACRSITISGRQLGEPPEYDRDKWIGEFKARRGDKEGSDLYRFSEAAYAHMDFVGNALAEYDLYPWRTPDNRCMPLYLYNLEGKFFGKDDDSNGVFPVMTDKEHRFELSFIFFKAHGGRILSGDTVRIKKEVADEKRFFGDWFSMEAQTYEDGTMRRILMPGVYFDEKDSDPVRQKWRITQTGKALGEAIGFDTPVQVQNIGTKRYLCISGSENYLASDETPYDWYLTQN